MTNAPDVTESLLERTKKLLTLDRDLTLREIANATEVGYEWLRSLRYRPLEELNPSVRQLERVHDYLRDYHAARRFHQRRGEVRAQ